MSTITDEKNSAEVTTAIESSETTTEENKMVVLKSSEKKMVVLKSSDNEEFQVEQSAAIQSLTIKNMLEECDLSVIPLPNVDSKTLVMVIQYLKLHADSESSSKEELKELDKQFVQSVVDSENETKNVLDLTSAANYLNITGLLDVTCQYVADTIKDFSPEEVRAYFNIENDFTPDEEAAIREENAWGFE